MVASDRISTYDAVHPTPIPDKGKVLTGLSAFWFEKTGGIVANHLISATRRACPSGARGRGAGRARARDAAGGVRRARLHHRLGLEGLPGAAARSRGSSCRRACASPSACPSRSSRRARRPTWATTRRSTSSAAAELVGDRALMRSVARRVDRAVLVRRRARARQRGVILADTKFEFGLDRSDPAAAAGARRRGADARTPRATGPLRATRPGRGQPSFDKQYVRDWASAQRLGQAAARAGDPRGRGRGHPGALRRGLRADHRRAVQRVARAQRRGLTARVPGTRPDPPEGRHPRPTGRGRRAGAAGARLRRRRATCTSAGWSSSTSRTPGSSQAMCEKLLANPLVEDYEVELLEGPAGESARARSRGAEERAG